MEAYEAHTRIVNNHSLFCVHIIFAMFVSRSASGGAHRVGFSIASGSAREFLQISLLTAFPNTASLLLWSVSSITLAYFSLISGVLYCCNSRETVRDMQSFTFAHGIFWGSRLGLCERDVGINATLEIQFPEYCKTTHA